MKAKKRGLDISIRAPNVLPGPRLRPTIEPGQRCTRPSWHQDDHDHDLTFDRDWPKHFGTDQQRCKYVEPTKKSARPKNPYGGPGQRLRALAWQEGWDACTQHWERARHAVAAQLKKVKAEITELRDAIRGATGGAR